jgi:hypothetical protein
MSGEQVGPRTGDFASFQCFDEPWDAYAGQVECFAKHMVYLCNRGELLPEELQDHVIARTKHRG